MTHKTNFSLTQIEYVVAVYKTGHFAKAADLCGVTQPTLSMQIKKLEDDLGVTLFDRSKKPILLTKTGQAVLEQLQTLLYEAKKVSSIIENSESKGVQGVLTVGIIPTISPYLLPLLLPVLSKKYPGLKLQIKEMHTQKIIDALETDDIDVGCLATPLGVAQIHEYPLYYEPFYVLCRQDHEWAPLKKIKEMNLKSDDIWLLEEGHCFRNQMVSLCSGKKKSHRANFEFESGSIETLKNIVEAVGGYTLLPALAAKNLSDGVKTLVFEKPIPSRQVGLVYRRKHYKDQLIEALGECIIQSLPEEIQKLRLKDLEVLPV